MFVQQNLHIGDLNKFQSEPNLISINVLCVCVIATWVDRITKHFSYALVNAMKSLLLWAFRGVEPTKWNFVLLCNHYSNSTKNANERFAFTCWTLLPSSWDVYI